MEKEITVIDAPCGFGKTSYAIQMMNEDEYQDKKYIYVTPYLREVERIQRDVKNRKFYTPNTENGITKSTSLLNLLRSGANIVTTHSLFSILNDSIIDNIEKNNYVLVMDEVFKVVEILSLKQGDIEILLNSEVATIDAQNWVHWNKEKEDIELSIKQYQKIRSGAIYGRLMVQKNKNGDATAMIWNFPSKIFESFKEVYLLTYLFNGQLQKYYFDLHNIKYNFQSVKKSGDRYYLVDYKNRDKLNKTELKKLINLYDAPDSEDTNRPNDKRRNLSYSACSTKSVVSKELLNKLKVDAYNIFQNVFKAKNDEVIWTMYKPALMKNNFNIRGYSGSTDPKKAGCFLPHNTRATNDYKDKNTIGYLIDRNLHHTYIMFFTANGVQVNEDIWRLSEMIQFIWRSAIREGNPINLYIPSKKMRDLFKRWLESEEFEEIIEPKEIMAA